MDKIIILKEKNEALEVIKLFKSKFLMDSFPASILKENNMKFMFLNSKIFYVEYDYTQFNLFLEKNNIDQFFILPRTVETYNWLEYEKEHLLGKETPFTKVPVMLIEGQPNFGEFQKDACSFLHYIEYYIFSKKLDWVVHYVPYRNFVIMYFNDEVSFDGLALMEDKIDNLQDLIENAELDDGFNEAEIKSLEKDWFPKLNSR